MSESPEVAHDLTSRTNGRDYRLKIWRPPGPSPEGGFPVLWVLDGSAYFGLLTDMVLCRGVIASEIAAAVVVGVTYPTEDLSVLMARRALDLTPTPGDGTHALADLPGHSFGGLDGFLDMIQHEAVEAVADRVPVDRNRMSILGHSFGGLAVLHAMFTRPAMFRTWLALSPSIWWDGRVVLRGEAGFAVGVRRGDVTPRVLIAVGSTEQILPDELPSDAPITLAQARQWNASARMVDNAAELAGRLAALPGSREGAVRYLCAPNESHASLPFAAARDALDLALGQFVPPLTSPKCDTVARRLDALFSPSDCDDGPGIVAGIARGGEIVHRVATGLASIEHGVRNAASIRMRIGSTSKQFASLAALLLAAEGKLDLDASATDILPELPFLRGVPTLRQFMNHTSGYRCSTDLAFIGSGMSLRPKGSLFATQVAQGDANFAPGEGQLYCNGGYHLLSIAIERAAGIPFGRFLKERIFAPLGMNDTQLLSSDMEIVPRMATMHISAAGGGWRRGLLPAEDVLGEGGIISTVDDMLIWLAHLRKRDVVGDERIWEQMMSPTKLSGSPASPYGLGLYRLNYRGVEVVMHGGGVPGGSCAMLTVPEHALDVIVMGNGGPTNLAELQYRIIDEVLGDQLRGDQALRPAAAEFHHLHGRRYLADNGTMFGFDAIGEELGLSLFGSAAAPIVHDTGATLQAGFSGIAAGPFVWQRAALSTGSAPYAVEMSEGGRSELFTLLPDRPPNLAEAATALVGTYRCDDLDAYAEIALQDQLVLIITTGFGSATYQLEPVSDNALIASHDEIPGFTMVISTAVDDTGFQMSGGRTRHLQFDRKIAK